ncbi:MAG: hypothetical protein ACI8Z1_002794 [Candidatus Azotimanducaceae bacterium]|jgi:hypothetical protein
MIFLFGERTRAASRPVGDHSCVNCGSFQIFAEHTESNWFSVFGIPLLNIGDTARFWRCEHCLVSYVPNQLDVPSAVPLLKKLVLYILLGYEQHDQVQLASEISLKLTNTRFDEDEIRLVIKEIKSGGVDMVAEARAACTSINASGKQQIIEAAFLATHACCELQYEDRLRINLIGNALEVGLEFVEYAIAASRRQNHYGIRRLPQELRAV